MNKLTQVDILAIGVHPDDVELGCAGTLLKHAKQGYTFGIVDLTRGELGTRGNADIRKQEAEKAAQVLGAEFRHNLEWEDGFFNYSKENILALVKIIRQTRPHYILANALYDRHPDHGRASHLVSDAAFYAGLIKIETKWDHVPQLPHRPRATLFYNQDYHIEPDIVVDISDVFEQKMEAIRCFASQFYNPHSTEPETPISGKDFFDNIRAKAIRMGRPAGYSYAEGFNVKRYIGIKNLFNID